MRFIADDGYCATAPALLTISVNRNLAPPRWLQLTREVTVLEIQPTGSELDDLSSIARDSDTGVNIADRISHIMTT